MDVLVTFRPEPGERGLVEDRLGPVRWLVDGVTGSGEAEGLLSMWPRRELRAAGIGWQDLPRLRWVKLITAGANHVGWSDLPEEVRVMTTPDATSPLIAEYVLGAVISWARGFGPFTRRLQRGEFPMGARARALSELRVGTLGHGSLAQAVARELTVRGAQVRAVSRTGTSKPGSPMQRVDPPAGLPALAAWADVLVVCAPLHRDTAGMVDAAVLERLGDGLLVNVARGPVVDEEALYGWLAAAPDGRAAVLDVWWRYPQQGKPFHAAFDTLPNVVMTPHNSGAVADFRARMIGQACQDLAAQRDTGSLEHVQSREDHMDVTDGDRA